MATQMPCRVVYLPRRTTSTESTHLTPSLPMQPYSRSGGTRKCFYEFQTLAACYTSADTASKYECTSKFDDYFECLHGIKERQKARTMLQQIRANEAKQSGVVSADLFQNSGKVHENLNLVK